MPPKLRATLLCVAALSLSGCQDPPEVAACEQFIVSRLQAPSTYKRVKVDEFGSVIGEKEYLQETGIDLSGPVARRDFNQQKALQFGKMDVFISYDAANAFGTPIRSTELCAFELKMGRLPDSDTLNERVRIAQRQAIDVDLIRAGLSDPSPSRPRTNRYACCMLH